MFSRSSLETSVATARRRAGRCLPRSYQACLSAIGASSYRVIRHRPEFASSRIFATRLLETNFASSFVAVQEAQTRFIVALARSPSTSGMADLHSLVDLALASPHATVRAIACTALTSPRLASSSASSDHTNSPWRKARLIAAQDPSDNVRTATIRVLGLLAKSDGPAAPSPADAQEAIPTLLSAVCKGNSGLSDGGGERLDGAMWTLANCCDVLAQMCVPSPVPMGASDSFL
jgi:hypothetical protein